MVVSDHESEHATCLQCGDVIYKSTVRQRRELAAEGLTNGHAEGHITRTISKAHAARLAGHPVELPPRALWAIRRDASDDELWAGR